VLEPIGSLGVDAMRVTLQWRPDRRNLTSRDHVELRRAVRASRRGVRVVLAVYGRSFDAPQVAQQRESYCRFARNVLVRYTEISDVVVWNEANSPAFWDPGGDAPAAYAALLGRCWDLLHSTVPGVNVLTTTAAGQDPVAFIRALGAAYRASGRVRPLFDTAGHNPYPRRPDEAPTATHDVYLGEGDYEWLAAALDESFAGTARAQSLPRLRPVVDLFDPLWPARG
jgi:hypothetical protein